MEHMSLDLSSSTRSCNFIDSAPSSPSVGNAPSFADKDTLPADTPLDSTFGRSDSEGSSDEEKDDENEVDLGDCDTDEFRAFTSDSDSDSDGDNDSGSDDDESHDWVPSNRHHPCVQCHKERNIPSWQSREQIACDGCGDTYCVEEHDNLLIRCCSGTCKYVYCPSCTSTGYSIQLAFYNSKAVPASLGVLERMHELPHGMCVPCTMAYEQCYVCGRSLPPSSFAACPKRKRSSDRKRKVCIPCNRIPAHESGVYKDDDSSASSGSRKRRRVCTESPLSPILR